ncbi:MAG: hypothetical protein H0T79_23285 [Deltaproteobacteria bacterium]|nr:hypothetical protein [Deltaproteobacteria bacterium]
MFRTNASYDRYWEGRRLVGAMVNRSRDFARQVANYIEDVPTREAIAKLVRAFYWLSAQTLRKHDDLAALAHVLDATQRTALAPLAFRAPVVLAWIGDHLFGIDEIGVEIEEPFGDDPNGLPIDAIGERIDQAVDEIIHTRIS